MYLLYSFQLTPHCSDGQGAVEERIGESIHAVILLHGARVDDRRHSRDEQRLSRTGARRAGRSSLDECGAGNASDVSRRDVMGADVRRIVMYLSCNLHT